MMTNTAERRGIALVMSILGIIVIGALVLGGFFMSSREYRTGRTNLTQARSLSAAEYGQNEVIRNWSMIGGSALAVGASTAPLTYTSAGGTATVRVTRLQMNLFSIVADGGAGASNAANDARRRTGMLLRLQTPVLEMLGALTARGSTRVGGSAFIDGNDYLPPGQDCGAAMPPKPALVVDDEDKVTYSGCSDQSCLSGTPKVAEDPRAALDDTYFKYGDTDWDDLVARANKFVSGTINGIGPTLASGACNTSYLYNWGDPKNGGPCKPYFPIIYSASDLHITGGFGQGILLVNGDLEVQGGFEFYGPVIVRGRLRTSGTGGHFNGGVMAANVDLDQNVVLGNAVIRYSSCAITNALLGIAMPKRVVERAWADLY